LFIVICIIAGLFLLLSLRLFRTAVRAGGAEGWLGLAFLCLALSMPLRVFLAQNLISESHAPTLLLAGHALMAAGLCGLTLFVDRVFRPNDGWARAITTTLILLQIVTLPALVFFGGHRTEYNFAAISISLIRALPFGWGFYESHRYYRQMKKRSLLGLSDPVVTNRFALFAIWNGALFALPVMLFLVRTWAWLGSESGGLRGDGFTAQVTSTLLTASLVLLGGSAVIALSMSFFPPRPWISFLERRAAAPAS